MKTDFQNVLFTDDGWSSGWLLHGRQPEVGIRRQQGGTGMFWAGIKGDSIIGPFKVEGSRWIQNPTVSFLTNTLCLGWKGLCAV